MTMTGVGCRNTFILLAFAFAFDFKFSKYLSPFHPLSLLHHAPRRREGRVDAGGRVFHLAGRGLFCVLCCVCVYYVSKSVCVCYIDVCVCVVYICEFMCVLYRCMISDHGVHNTTDLEINTST